MKIFVVHFNLGCCSNNSDGKMWVSADNKELAIQIAEKVTEKNYTLCEEFDLENEVIFTTFDIKNKDMNFKLSGKTDNWGKWRDPLKPIIK